MKHGKIWTCVLMIVIISLFVITCANDTIINCWKCAVTGMGRVPIYKVSVAYDDTVWGMGRENDQFYMSRGTMESGNKGTSRFDLGLDCSNFIVGDLFAVSKDLALVAGYQIDKEGKIEDYRIFKVNSEERLEGTLLQKECSGKTSTDRKASVRVGEFSQYDNVAVFALWKDGETTIYRITVTGKDQTALQKVSSFSTELWKDAVVLENGMVLLSWGTNHIDVYSTQGIYQFGLEVSGIATRFYSGKDALYYMDISTSSLNNIRQEEGSFVLGEQIPVGEKWDISILSGGGILWSDDGVITSSLSPETGNANYVLYLSRAEGILMLSLIFVGIVVLSCILVSVISRRYRITIFFQGVALVVALVSLMSALLRTYIPMALNEAVQETQMEMVDFTSGFGGWFLKAFFVSNEESAIQGFSEAVDCRGQSDSSITIYRYVPDGFEIVCTTTPDLIRGAVVKGDDLLLKARETGAINQSRETINGKFYVSVSVEGQYLTKAEVHVLQPVASQERVSKLLFLFAILLIPIVIISILCLSLYRTRIRRLDKKVIAITSGDYETSVVSQHGDEFEPLARNIDIVRQLLKDSEDKRRRIDESYMRFIPDQIIRLLGAGSLDELTRETVENRDMVVMTVFFQVPGDDISTERLFSLINTVIQRTTFATVAYEGINFNFNENGYTVVFPGDSLSEPMRAALAVKGAMDRLNAERRLEGRKAFRLKIALDYGSVQLGMVGDELYMVPTVISHCMEKNQKMIRLGSTLDANILLSESMMRGMENPWCRFVGKFRYFEGTENLYELYEGDGNGLADRKNDTKADFNRAIRAFYQGEYTTAKQILMQLARTGSGQDGALRYYLNLADRFEREPPDQFLL